MGSCFFKYPKVVVLEGESLHSKNPIDEKIMGHRHPPRTAAFACAALKPLGGLATGLHGPWGACGSEVGRGERPGGGISQIERTADDLQQIMLMEEIWLATSERCKWWADVLTFDFKTYSLSSCM